MKVLLFFSIFVFGAVIGLSQEVTVTATVSPKEVNAILAKEREAARTNRAYFDEEDKCRDFLKKRDSQKAEASCRLAVSLVEKLPSEHVLERSSARTNHGIALLYLKKEREAILMFKRSIDIRLPRAGEADVDTADIYSWLGTAYGLLGEVQSARSYFEKAESSYRAAFNEIGNDCDGIRFSYPRRMKTSLETHYLVVKSAGLFDEAEILRSRLVELEKEYDGYLSGQDTKSLSCK